MNKRQFPWIAAIGIIMTLLVAYFFFDNFGKVIAIKIVVVGTVIAVVGEIVPRMIGFTHKKFGWTSFVWGVIILVAAILLALGGWINVGSGYITKLVQRNSYVTITVAKHAPIAFLLDGNSFGIVDAGGKFVPVGQFSGTNMIWAGNTYTVFAVQVIANVPIVATGQDVLLVEFIP